MCWVSLQCVNWAVMLSGLKTKPGLNFDRLPLIRLKDVTLFRSDKILERTRVLIVLQSGSTKEFGHRLVVDLEGFR